MNDIGNKINNGFLINLYRPAYMRLLQDCETCYKASTQYSQRRVPPNFDKTKEKKQTTIQKDRDFILSLSHISFFLSSSLRHYYSNLLKLDITFQRRRNQVDSGLYQKTKDACLLYDFNYVSKSGSISESGEITKQHKAADEAQVLDNQAEIYHHYETVHMQDIWYLIALSSDMTFFLIQWKGALS